MTFFSLSNPRSVVSAPTGSAEKEVKQLRISPDGNKSLEVVGKTNIYEKIQSFKGETDIKTLISRYERGDFSALNKKTGEYFDARPFPKHLSESYEVLRTAENVYNSLNNNQRSNYSSFGEFLNSFGSVDGIKLFIDGFYTGNDKSIVEQEKEGE